jgi:hypothetical protein
VSSVGQLPYPVHDRAGGGSGAALSGGNSSGGGGSSHPLDGVVFQLSPRLTTDTELDQMSLAVEAVMTRYRYTLDINQCCGSEKFFLPDPT